VTGLAAARGEGGGRRLPFLLAVVTAAVAVALLVARAPDLG
jgi:hypothetical protein